MTEVDCRLPKMPEGDPLVRYHSFTALTVTSTGGRAETRVQHRPPMLKITPTTPKQSSAQKSYKPPSKVAMRRDTSTTGLYGINPAPYQARPPKKHPDLAIPPKPPYFDSPTNKMTVEQNVASSHHAFGHIQEELSSSSTDIQWSRPTTYQPSNSILTASKRSNPKATAESKRGNIIQHDAKTAAQRQQWDQMREFHAGIRPWLVEISRQEIDGDTPLIRTMLQPPPATTQLSTYSWNGHEAATIEIDCSQAIARPPRLSQSMWNSRKDSGGTSWPITPNTALRYIRRTLALAKNTTQSPPLSHQFLRTLHHNSSNGSICEHSIPAISCGHPRNGRARRGWKVAHHSFGLCFILLLQTSGFRPTRGQDISKTTCPGQSVKQA